MLKKTIVSYLKLKPYNVLFHVLPQIGFDKPDRVIDIKYQRALDIEFRAILSSLKVEVVEVKSSDSNKRLQEIIPWLEGYSEKS